MAIGFEDDVDVDGDGGIGFEDEYERDVDDDTGAAPEAAPEADGLTDEIAAILFKLAGYESALVPFAAIPGLIGGGDEEAVATLLVALVNAGWLEVWRKSPAQRCPCVILSSRAAAALGLETDTNDHRDLAIGRWVPRGECRARRIPWGCVVQSLDVVAPGRPEEIRETRADTLVDPRVENDPARAAMLAEAMKSPAIRRYFQGKSRTCPFPTIILGLRDSWPLPQVRGQPCPGCAGRPLQMLEACAWCNRVGGEASLPKLTDAECPRPRARSAAAPDGLAGGQGEPAKPRTKFVADKPRSARERQRAMYRANKPKPVGPVAAAPSPAPGRVKAGRG